MIYWVELVGLAALISRMFRVDEQYREHRPRRSCDLLLSKTGGVEGAAAGTGYKSRVNDIREDPYNA